MCPVDMGSSSGGSAKLVDCCMLHPQGPGLLAPVPRVGCRHLIVAVWTGASVPLAVVRVVSCLVVPHGDTVWQPEWGHTRRRRIRVCRGELGAAGV